MFEIAVVGLLSFILVVEGVSRSTKLGPEVTRKLIHVAASTFVGILPMLVPFWFGFVFGWCCLGVMFVLEHNKALRSLSQVNRVSYGGSFLILGALIAGLVGNRFGWDGFFATYICLAWADTGAAMARQSKTWRQARQTDPPAWARFIDSLTFFDSLVFFGVFAVVMIGLSLPYSLDISIFLKLLLISGLAAVIEKRFTYGSDNLFVPVSVFLLFQAFI